MTDKSFCPAVKDLLPLYEDGALSRETEELVSGHLRQCGACRAYYEEMKGVEPDREEETEERMRYRKIAKRIHHRRLGAAGLVLLLCMGIFIVKTQ